MKHAWIQESVEVCLDPCALSTPRISLVDPNVRVRPCSRVVRGGAVGRVVPGVVRLGGYRVGSTPPCTHPVSQIGIARAQPVAGPCPPGTPGPSQGPPHTWAPAPVGSPDMARFHHIYTKVSHKSRVSPKKRDEACHTPYIKNP